MGQNKSYLIGIDGGAARTRGIITTESGKICAQAMGGSSNQHSNTLDVVKWNIQTIIRHLMTEAGCDLSEIRGVCLGLAGVDKPSDAKRIHNMVSSLVPQSDINVVNDAVIALYGGCMKPYGIIVISGTGSIAYGRNPAGMDYRTGGWGHILGDEGSGYGIAISALRAVCHAVDRRGEPTILTKMILEELNLENPVELIDWISEITADKASISGLTPVVYEAFSQGDHVAKRILTEQAGELVRAITAVHHELFKDTGLEIEVVVGGSNLTKSDLYYEIFKSEAEKQIPGISVIRPRRDAVYGAIIYLHSRYGLLETSAH